MIGELLLFGLVVFFLERGGRDVYIFFSRKKITYFRIAKHFERHFYAPNDTNHTLHHNKHSQRK